jgi:hypothetical protein
VALHWKSDIAAAFSAAAAPHVTGQRLFIDGEKSLDGLPI